MNSLQKLTLIATVAILGVARSAGAADIPEDPPVVELPPVEKFGGWYLRGDISADWVDTFSAKYAGNSYTSTKIDQGYNFGIGAGYQITEYLRADLTLERFGSDFSGSTVGSCAFTAGGTAIAGSCSSVESAKFTAWTGMANAYIDLGTFSGITPYAGLGLGASYVSWDSYQSVDTCTRTSVATNSCFTAGTAAYVAPGAGGVTSTRTTSYNGNQSWLFSYAFMAGFSYDLNENLKLDVGYKYTNIATGALIDNIGGGVSVDHSALGIHAVRLGLRYQVW